MCVYFIKWQQRTFVGWGINTLVGQDKQAHDIYNDKKCIVLILCTITQLCFNSYENNQNMKKIVSKLFYHKNNASGMEKYRGEMVYKKNFRSLILNKFYQKDVMTFKFTVDLLGKYS